MVTVTTFDGGSFVIDKEVAACCEFFNRGVEGRSKPFFMSICHAHQGIGEDGQPIPLPKVPANVLGKVSENQFGSQLDLSSFLRRPRFWNTVNITRRN